MEYLSTSTGSHLAGMQTKMIKHALEYLYENLHVFSQTAEFSLPSQFQDPWRNQRGNKLGLGSVFYIAYTVYPYICPLLGLFFIVKSTWFNLIVTSQNRCDRQCFIQCQLLPQGYARLSLSSHFHARLKLPTDASSYFNAPQFWRLTQHGKLHTIFQRPPFLFNNIVFFGTLQINNLAPPGRRPRRRWAVHHLQVHMFRRRAGHRGNVSLLDQENVVLNQINITTLLFLSGKFTPRINSYRNQRFFLQA